MSPVRPASQHPESACRTALWQREEHGWGNLTIRKSTFHWKLTGGAAQFSPMGPTGLLGLNVAVKQRLVLKQEYLRPLMSQSLSKMLILSGLKEPAALTVATPLDLQSIIKKKDWWCLNGSSWLSRLPHSPELHHFAVSTNRDIRKCVIIQILDAI